MYSPEFSVSTLLPGTIMRKLCLLIVFSLGISLSAQTNEEVFREFQFNFSPPGARANGMGSTFIGLADDASATYANPAGLAFLRDPALTLEYAYTSRQKQIGESSGTINFGYTQEPVIFENISFFSLNFHLGEWYFALFGHDFLEEQQDRSFTARSLSGNIEQITTLGISLNLSGQTYGVGTARRFGPLKIGLTFNSSSLTIQSRSKKQKLTLYPTYQTETFTTSINSDQTANSWSAGFLWKFSEQWSLGAVFKENPYFDLQESVSSVTSGQPISSSKEAVTFVVPDLYGIGLSFSPKPGIHLLLDWQHIYYSQILETGFSIVENPETDSKDFYDNNDVDELHFGSEYLLPLKSSVFALRAGYYRNPNHFIRYTGDDPVQSSLFSQNRGAEENHYTFGVGWSSRNRFELDLAMDLWGDNYTVLASVLWRKK